MSIGKIRNIGSQSGGGGSKYYLYKKSEGISTFKNLRTWKGSASFAPTTDGFKIQTSANCTTAIGKSGVDLTPYSKMGITLTVFGNPGSGQVGFTESSNIGNAGGKYADFYVNGNMFDKLPKTFMVDISDVNASHEVGLFISVTNAITIVFSDMWLEK